MEKPLAQQIEELKKAIAAQDSIRALVGDEIADSALKALRDQLALLEGVAAASGSSRDKRKIVTVMNADISGFTHLSEKIDVEDLMQLTNQIWQKLDRIILSHGGYIDRHEGDSVMALWGVDLAREDDAEQAVRAGLKMLEAVREMQGQYELDLHTAIHSGAVLLGEVGVQREYTAIGNTVNLASYLKDVTPAGCIYTTAETHQLIRGLFEVEKLAAQQLKGVREPVPAYRVLHVFPHAFRPHTRGVEGIRTRMVGREAELSHLQNGLVAALEKGRMGFTIVVGDAGLGKSRLLYEFEKWVETRPQPLTIVRGRATVQSMLTPYSLLRVCLDNWIGADESYPLSETRAWLEQGIIDLFGGDESAIEKAHIVGQLAGIDFSDSPHVHGILSDPRQIRDRAYHYLNQILHSRTKKKPVVFLFEDLHWADLDSLALIHELVEDSSDVPVYIVAVTRPTLFERVKWGLDHPAYDCFHLKPLTEEGCHALVHEILQKTTHIPPALEELVIQGADGNPYYVEELIKMLIEEDAIVTGEHWYVDESRLGKVHIPATLVGILQARLDSLPPIERLILQCAAVVGKIFWSDAVSYIHGDKGPGADEALKSLQARELIFLRETSSFAGIPEFTFKHAILRDVTYESVLKRDRRFYHRRAAEWLVEHAGERAESLAALVAEHFEHAESFEPAAEWNALAGKNAADAYATETAILYYQKALRYATDAKLPAGPNFDWYEALGKALFACGRYEDVNRTYREMLESAKAARALRAQAKAWYNISFMQDYAGDIRASLDGAEKSEALARKAQDQPTLVNALIGQGWCYYRLGENDTACQIAQEALAMAQTLPDSADSLREQAHSYQLLGAAQEALGKIPASQESEARSLQAFRDLRDRRGEAVMLNNQGVGAFWRGDYETALRAYEDSLEIARSIGLRDREGIFLSNLAGAQVGAGLFPEAEANLRQAIAIVGGQAAHYLPHTYIFLAEALLGQSRLAEAVETAQKACQIAKEAEQPESFSTALRTMGDCLSAAGNDVDRIRACYRESERLAAEIHADADRARSLRAWAKFEYTHGNSEEARAMLVQAKAIFEQLGMEREAQKCLLLGDAARDDV